MWSCAFPSLQASGQRGAADKKCERFLPEEWSPVQAIWLCALNGSAIRVQRHDAEIACRVYRELRAGAVQPWSRPVRQSFMG